MIIQESIVAHKIFLCYNIKKYLGIIMKEITYEITQSPLTPLIVTRGKYSTPVWMQSKWKEGQYSEYIVRNGCGHCCTAMALNLMGKKQINPHQEFELCRQLFGPPSTNNGLKEDNFMSVAGITKILSHFNVKAKFYGIAKGTEGYHLNNILWSLENDKLVIFSSHPTNEFVENPFSTGEHYVLFIGHQDNQVITLNTSSKGIYDVTGIQFVSPQTIKKAMPVGCTPADYLTWGVYPLEFTMGYVVIG